MDLSYTRFDTGRATALPVELAVLLVGVAARQAASPTARIATLATRRPSPDHLLRPESGSFSAAAAAALMKWQKE